VTVPDKVTISHRGTKYEIGRGKRYYGIWVNGAPESDPIDRWPETRDGWTQAWTRFTTIETPGTIQEAARKRGKFALPRVRLGARRPRMPRIGGSARALAGAGLLGFGVLLGLIGLFPGYIGSSSLASQAYQLVPHLTYLATWIVSAALIVVGARSSRPGMTRTGALLGIGLSAVTFGLFFAELGEVISGGASLLGAGLILSLLGWAACAAGCALAFTARPGAGSAPAAPVTPAFAAYPHGFQGSPGGPVRPRVREAGPIALLVLAAIGTVAAFMPSWDSYTLAQSSTGSTQTITAGNAFSNPGVVIAGDVAVMLAVVAVAVLAALWRPARQGAALLAGAIVPLAAQAISALIEVSQPATPSMFGISQSQASAAGLTISSGVTPIFWVYCVFVISLVISCAWLLTAPQYPAMPVSAQPPAPGPGDPSQSVSADTDYSDDGDSDDADSDDGAEEDEESTYA
jgi:hypothetical protein